MLLPLPIDAVLSELVSAVRSHHGVVLRAPTGAGKTTRVPPALLDAGITHQRIIVLEPRRAAARAAARRMSAERETKLGTVIGYQVRFDRCFNAQTQILVVTPGILLRMLLEDSFLEAVGVVVFDEFHERGLESDLALGLVRLLQQTVRPDLRMVVMSATLETEVVAEYLNDGPVIVSEGRLFPVSIRYEPPPSDFPLPIAVARATETCLNDTDGDLLVFLPGLGEIRRTAETLEPLVQRYDFAIMPLHGDLPPEQQDSALMIQPRRKVVLATNVAETSVTVEGITGVIDTGLARIMQFDPTVGLDRLELTPISKASADQRAGRAGRTRPGTVVRLWSEVAHRSRPDRTEAEIQRVDLAGAVLQLAALGELEVKKFPWLEPPPDSAIEQAKTLLHRLDALNETGITDVGRRMVQLPVHPRVARMLIEGEQRGYVERIALAASLLSERDPFIRSLSGSAPSVHRWNTSSDVLDRVEALEAFESTGQSEFPIGNLHSGGAKAILRARDQLVRLLDLGNASPPTTADEALGMALFQAFPDRLARRRERGSDRGVMVGGRGIKLAVSSGVVESELFVCVDVDAGKTESIVRQASAVRRDWLSLEKITTTFELAFDEETERVTCQKTTRFEDLILDQVPAKVHHSEAATTHLVEAALRHPDRVFPAADSPAGQWLIRLRCLREWIPELGLPRMDEAEMRELLGWMASGKQSFEELRRADWIGALSGKLSYEQIQVLEREAPERWEVPSGSNITLAYELGRPPILAVRIQEMFGLADTPRIARGRVKVLLHLLAPNFRPQQVTDDLASFWVNTYPRVRGELRARYPKHAWPDDPLSAEPLRGPKRRPKPE